MAAVPGASELLPLPVSGRRFTTQRSVRLGDVDAGQLLRLDATSRYLQDIATDDAADCDLDARFGWVVRRTMAEVVQPAVLEEHLSLTTYCTGIGRSWAERRTSIVGEQGARIECVSLWIQVDATTGRPARISDQFVAIYGEACGGRVVSARLALGAPTDDVESSPWFVRRVDIDPFNHVNNAANWAFLEEAVGTFPTRIGRAEMEFLGPVEYGMATQFAVSHTVEPSVCDAWLLVDGKALSAARWQPGS